MAINTKPPKGTQDLLPRAARRRAYITQTIRRTYEAHGFEPLSTPAIENLSVLLGKYGDEGEGLIFRLMKRGASLHRALGADEVSEGSLADMGLRYDLTVPLARVVAQHSNDIPRFFKRYQIQPVWRAERPQKGRLREFTQCDADIAGCASPVADAEVLSAGATALSKLGFEGITFHTNHRDVLFGLIETAGIPAEMEGTALVAVDKLDKIGWEGVVKELGERGLSPEQIGALRGLLDFEADDNAAILDRLERELAVSERGQRGVKELRDVVALTRHNKAGEFLKITPSLARGLSYYTGTIFEVTHPKLRGSIASGGRYDGLIGMFQKRDVTAVGCSLGLERLEIVMEELGLFPDKLDSPDVMVAFMAGNDEVASLAADLRSQGLSVDVFLENTKLLKQFKYAEVRGIPFAAIAGPDEIAEGVVAIRDLRTRDQVKVPRGEVADHIARNA